MIIGLTGNARVGKDTAARGLTGWIRRAFADELKREVAAFALSAYKIMALNCTPEQKELIRWLMVGHGRTMRAIDPQYWIGHVEASMQMVDNAPLVGKMCSLVPIKANFVVTDVRYRNEAEWVESKGGRTIMIVRHGYGPANETEAQSIGELIASGLVSATIDNDGTIEELHEKTRAEVLR